MKYETINLGTKLNPQTGNLGIDFTPTEKSTFIKLFKEFKDVFAWTYDDLKTFNPQVMQHIIPIKQESRPFQQILRKYHSSLEPTIKNELNKLLVARIIFPIRHTQWVANLVPVRNKNDDI